MAELVPLEAIEAAVEAAGWSWDPNGDPNIPTPGECMAEILEAAAPFIARQTAERIAEAIGLERNEALDTGSLHRVAALGDAAYIARQVGSDG